MLVCRIDLKSLNVIKWLVLGDFQIDILHDNVSTDTDNSYIAHAFDVNKVKISDFPSSVMVDSPAYFISK